MKKYKIVERTHNDGSKTYGIKVKVFPFIWVYVVENWGICTVTLKNMDLKTANKKKLELIEKDNERKGKKVTNKKVIEYF